MRHLIVLIVFCAAFIGSPAARAEDRVIFVLDASGSMWGQIEGAAKISVARAVLGDLLPTLPRARAYGLVAYGHRTEGDCSDIETLVPATRDAQAPIRDALATLSPLGKSPMTAAVRHAADALEGVEGNHTVILISDGVETCAPDPCAAAQALADHHATLTVNVVGFDIREEEARAQLRCLAEETKGVFLSAATEEELTGLLPQISAPPDIPRVAATSIAEPPSASSTDPRPTAPPPVRPEATPEPALPVFHLVPILFTATQGEAGPKITDQLFWQITNREGMIIDTQDAPEADVILEPGAYQVIVRNDEDGHEARVDFEVTGETRPLSLMVALPSDTSVSH